MKYFDEEDVITEYEKQLQKKDNEIERLTDESTEWESKFYDEARKVDKAIEIYENRNSIEYKKKRFMEDKTIAYFMYEELKGDDKE